MVDFKKVKAPNNTITRNPAVLAAKADNNIYEAVAIIAKRSNQIAVEMKEELSRKLQEFASYTDNLARNPSLMLSLVILYKSPTRQPI